ncbi:MAG: DUF3419 family protein [Bacteroidetes bacterium]|jgi:S-adenosylmethionine-diacylglycerol 3-amino-3-carboxypropyl transferase|nr:DUF3419 family protein [Bacteroidota bacterium]MBT3749435.1 DUF3419 family protein [Bacteroidota bacterium]MBT4398807.1 DUF3419 family protein [Bacteroidota bacterium]MBT4411995.1 DUF3419 family protein [Bacteroidota bacterium]MBT5425206.1 DUF3419 family protein [Bacteroidota bacterium]
MEVLFNFGLSQDDSRTEKQFLKLSEDDHVLCLASGGEVPLDLISGIKDIHIDAVDTDQNQLFLAQLKHKAAIHLDPNEAALLLGYSKGSEAIRRTLLSHLKFHLSEAEKDFWKHNIDLFNLGPIHAGRFETYIRKYNKIVSSLLGKKHLIALMGMNDRAEQEDYFDHYFRVRLLKFIFRIAFHPRIYKSRGVVEEGLQHSKTSNMAEFFYSRFRNFCVANPAAKNGYYQFTFFNEMILPEAFPDFLQVKNLNILRAQTQNLNFFKTDIMDHLKQVEDNYYSKIALSNLSDWMSCDEITSLLDIILKKVKPGARILARYIHAPIILSGDHADRFEIDYEQARDLMNKERYPFYSLIPMVVT